MVVTGAYDQSTAVVAAIAAGIAELLGPQPRSSDGRGVRVHALRARSALDGAFADEISERYLQPHSIESLKFFDFYLR